MIKARSGAMLRIMAILAIFLGLVPMTNSFASAQAQLSSRFFAETGQTVQGRFLEYWEQNGGLLQQGYPISGELQDESPIDGKTYTMQYFERAVFEMHPENAAPNDVLLSLLGTLEYNRKYPNGALDQRENHDAGGVQFAETGKWVGGSFLVFFNAHGGVRQQGLPISNEFQERSELDGQIRTVQYFERAVFEWNPDNQPPYNVLLAQLGTFAYKAKQSAGEPTPPLLQPIIPAPVNPNNGQYYPHASGRYMVWNEGQIAGPVDRQQPSQFDIRALDMATNQAIDVTTAQGNQIDPKSDGSLVAWRSENYGCGNCPDNGVYAEDMVSGVEVTIALDNEINDQHEAESPVVAGRYVAWVQLSGNNQQHLFAKNIDNRAVIEARTLITGTATTPDVQTQIEGLQGNQNFLVWGEISYEPLDPTSPLALHPFNIYAYNLTTERLFNIYSNYTSGYQNSNIPAFSLNDGQVLLADKVGNLSLINLKSNVQTDIPYKGDVQEIALYGDKVLVTADTASTQINGFGFASDEQQIVHLLQPDPNTLPADLPSYSATIAGDWLVWGDSAAPNPRLSVKELDLKSTQQAPLLGAPAIPTPDKFIGQFSPVASNGYLYWQECSIANFSRRDCSIRSLNSKTSEVNTATSNLDDPVNLAAAGSNVVWSYRPIYCKENCMAPGIYMKEGDSPATAVVTGTIYRDEPAIADNIVVWNERDDDVARVMVKDLTTGEIKPIEQVTSSTIYFGNIQASNDYMAWVELNTASSEGHKSSIRVYSRKSGDIATILAFDYTQLNAQGLRVSLDGHNIAIALPGVLFVRDLQTDKQIDLANSANNSYIWGLLMRGNALIFSASTIVPNRYGGPERVGVYGVALSQPDVVQTLVAPQAGGYQSYGFAALDKWLVYSDSSAQQPLLNVLPLPDSLKQ